MDGVIIGTTTMRSATSGQSAAWDPDAGAWTSTRVGGRLLTRDETAASVMLAELESLGYGGSPNARSLRGRLGLPAP